MKKILKNLLVAIGIISYFMILFLANSRMNTERLANDIKVFAGAFLVVAILALEKAYKKDCGKTAIIGIELLILSFHSLSIMHMVNIFKCDFNFYLIISAVVVAGYYILKGIVTYTKDRKEYLKGLSDISEIVKEDEPIKKEAKKRSPQKQEKVKEIVNDDKKENVEIKKRVNTKKKTTSTKKTSTGSKKAGTKKTTQPEEKSEEKVQIKRKTTSKTTKVEETKIEDKPKTARKRTANKKKEAESTSKTPKKKKTSTTATTTKKSEKEVKEND